MDFKLVLIVPLLVTLLIVLYNRNTPRELILALNILIILLLNDIIRSSEHFQETMIDKSLMNNIKEMILDADKAFEKRA